MNKTRKVDLLYAKAKGQASNATTQELLELKKYRVASNEESFYVTKANISAYVTAVDKGYPLSYYDWCVSNGKADRRRKGSSEEAIKSNDKSNTIGAVVAGFFLWALAIYWLTNGAISPVASLVIGAVVSLVLFKLSRKAAGFTLVFLPIILAVIAFMN